jgi:hypothetical protein
MIWIFNDGDHALPKSFRRIELWVLGESVKRCCHQFHGRVRFNGPMRHQEGSRGAYSLLVKETHCYDRKVPGVLTALGVGVQTKWSRLKEQCARLILISIIAVG